ncbi:MAG: gamma-glutamyltranspeptidase / glutathione hydrolase, partial [Gaiellaceae bacterium]|nr:gamma-glutamyltranspeptidase / glutathione hydrolase [Gaiellaceae bacterium]
ARAGIEILADGGSAADAAVAASLASCVAETVMTGLLGGGHAIHFDAATGTARNLDCFCAVPGLGREWHEPELLHLDVPFGAELVHYAVGPASCAVPGVPAGLGALWEEHGRLPWHRLVEPALQLARDGVAMPAAHVACLAMLEPVMTMREGARIYAPGGTLLEPGDRLEQPGLVPALESLADEGARGAYEGTIGRALLELSRERGGLVTEDDLTAYRPVWSEPVDVGWLGRRFLTRGGLSGVPETLPRLPRLGILSPAERVVALVRALGDVPGPDTHTTNLVVVDPDGNACVVTTSLGLGSGDWLPGLDLHLNSMLGEADLLLGPLTPGARMQSMMAPSLVLDGEGLELAIGAAGGTRLRTALVGVAAGILDERLAAQAAVDRPRAHPAGGVVNAEPGVDDDGLHLLEAAGLTVRRWPARHHYFGGVSAVGRSEAAADPRRTGSALPFPTAG